MTTLTIILLAVLVIRRTKLAVMVTVATLAGEAVVSSYSQINQVDQGLWVTGICILLALACKVHWKNNNNEVSKYITWLSFAVAGLSFARVSAHGVLIDPVQYIWAQNLILALVDWTSMVAIACLLILPDKPVFLHDMAANIRHGVTWVRDSVYLFSNKGN